MTRFTNKAWLVLKEDQGGGFGCRSYRLDSIHNKPSSAQSKLDELNKSHTGFYPIYSVKEVELDKEIELFRFDY